jgi:PAS domain S-box-containing protein
MKISSKLFLAVFVPVLLVLVVGSTLIFSYVVMEAAFDNGDKVRLIRNGITELNHLVFSYITYREERPKQQFQAEYNKLILLLAGVHFRNPDHQQLLNEIKLISQFMNDAFLRLASNTVVSDTSGSNRLLKEVEQGVAGQLLIRSHNADSIASNLKSLVDEDLKKSQTNTLAFIFLVLILTSFPLGFVLIRTKQSIISDLTKLRRETEVISSGNLDHFITVERNDELGDLTHAFNRMTSSLKEVTASKTDLEQEMAERQKAEKGLRASRKFLEIANRHTDLNLLLQDFVEEMKEFTGCQAVGIRLREENGTIPYMAYQGFSQKFYETEGPLSLNKDQCMCINVVKGTTDPGLSFYTKGGSFYMNGTTQFLATVCEEDKGQTRNVCNQMGYESVALIPIRLGPQILGLIHLADCNENMVPLDTVMVVEQVASALGIGIQRTKTEEELQQQREWFRVTLTSIGDAVMTTDASGKITFLNPVAQALTGWKPEETRGQPVENIFKIINQQNHEPAEDIVRRVLKDGSVVTLSNHTALISREGKLIPIEDSAAPIKDDAGNIFGVVLVFHDVTEKRRAQEELRRSRDELEMRVQERTSELTAEIEQHKQSEEALQESKKQLRILASQIITAQENERKRIALEVHDILGSSLSAIKFKVEEALLHLSKDGPLNVSKPLETIIPLILDTIGEARRIQSDLRPPLLDDLGILATLSWFCRRFEGIYSYIKLEQSVTIQEEEVPDHLKISLFRVTQEAMNNIGKYAKADTIYFQLQRVGGTLELRIRDNGEGFDLESLSFRDSLKKGLGLSSMKERVEFSGGFFSIESGIGKGTVVRAVWPV